MALVFAAHPALPGRSGTIKSGRVASVASKRGFRTMTRAIDLAGSTYEAGGWLLTPGLTGLAHVNDVTQPGGWDPFGTPIVPTGLQAVLDYSDPVAPKLQVWADGAEVAALPESGALWVTFHGRDV